MSAVITTPTAPKIAPVQRFAVGQRVRFRAGLYVGNSGAIESVSHTGRVVVRSDNRHRTGFGVNPTEVVEWLELAA